MNKNLANLIEVGIVVLSAIAIYKKETEMPLTLIIWDVQHGSAAYIQTPNGKRIAIDLGASEGVSPLKELQDAGVWQLDHLTITHPHMDHIDDILNLDQIQPKAITLPWHLTEEDIRGNQKLQKGAEEKLQRYLKLGKTYARVTSENDITDPRNTGGVAIKMFYPKQASRSNLNNHSVVTTIEYRGIKILIPGDNESDSWEELLRDPKFRGAIHNTHVLVASHHGRDSGYYGKLFDCFQPTITIISDGPVVGTSVTSKYDNHTKGWKVFHRSTEKYEKRKCVTTRKDGDIKLTLEPTNMRKTSMRVEID